MAKEKLQQQLFQLLDEELLTQDFISALAGDRQLHEEEIEQFNKIKEKRGNKIFVDILFTLTHKYFPQEIAETLWNEILFHKTQLSIILDRNVGIIIATLDYLHNRHDKIDNPLIISEKQITTIAEIALKDRHTNLFDSNAFWNKLKLEIKRYQRYQTSVSIIMCDIDNFKKINDTHGHLFGDKIITEIANIINNTTRDLDIPARFGGEEFVVILPHTDTNTAVEFSERIRLEVEQHYSNKEKITISIGVAECPTHAITVKEIVKKADEALYQSKNNGKNRVTIYSNNT